MDSRLEKNGKRPQTAELEVNMLFDLTTVIVGRISFLKTRSIIIINNFLLINIPKK